MYQDIKKILSTLRDYLLNEKEIFFCKISKIVRFRNK